MGQKSCTFLTQHFKPFKTNDADFSTYVRKMYVMKCNYKFLANLLHIFVKYAKKYCIIGDVICINMHHLTVQHIAVT